MAKVFISHAREDLEPASALQQWLTDAGYEAFLDQDMPVGEEWAPRLHERLRASDAVVCVVTSDYQASEWCNAELGAMLSQGARVLPVLAEQGAEHPLLRHIQHINYGLGSAAVTDALVEALREIDVSGGQGWPDDLSPFPGLQPFDVDRHRAFFGRAEDVRRLTEVLRNPAIRADAAALLVVGPSGCGKSSLVRAGLIPKIGEDPEWWVLNPITPSTEPVTALTQELAAAAQRLGLDWTGQDVRERLDRGGLAELAGELLLQARRGRGRRLLIVVDQFEWLVHAASAERHRFAEVLRPALTGPVRLVGTVGLEYLDQMLADHELRELPMQTFTLRPLGPEALRTVIEEPAGLARINVDRELVDLLVEDTGGGEALPLLAFTLAELAKDVGRNQWLSHERYDQLGGVQGALTQQADTALAEAAQASGRNREEVITGLLRLVTVDENGHRSRRRVLCTELPAPVATELDAFIRHRLLITVSEAGEPENGAVFVEVAHDRFLSAWQPMAVAIARVASALQARDAVERAATQWSTRNRPSWRLWEGNQLAAAVHDLGARAATEPSALPRRGLSRWIRQRHRALISDRVDLSERARDFLHQSTRRDRYQRRRASTVLSVLLTIALVAAVIASWQQQSASDQRDRALSRAVAIAANQLRSSDPALSRQLSVAGYRISPTTEALGELLSSASLPRVTRVANHEGETWATVASPDRRTVATAGSDGLVRLWAVSDPTHPTPVATIRAAQDAVFAVAFSPDGTTLATASYDNTARLWDITNPRSPRPLSKPLTGHQDRVSSVAFSPDGTTLATGSYDTTVRIWDVTNPGDAPLVGEPLTGHGDLVNSVAFSPDGTTLATGGDDNTARLWDITDRQEPYSAGPPLSLHSGDVNALAFSPDGTTLATASADYTVRLWDVADPDSAEPIGGPLEGHENAIYSIAFSADGTQLVSGSNDNTVRVWDVAAARALQVLPHPQPVQGTVFLTTADEIVTAGNDGTLRLWHLPGTRLSGRQGPLLSTVFSPDGRTVATGSQDGSVILWDVTDPAHPRPSGPPLNGDSRSEVQRMAFSPNGQLLAVPRVDGTIELWKIADPAKPVLAARPSIAHQGDVLAVAFNPDGSVLASGGADSTVRLWDIADPANPSPLGTPLGDRKGAVFTVAFSSDGTMLAAGGGDRTTRLYDVSDPTRPGSLGDPLAGHKGYVLWVAFGLDNTLATAGADGLVWLWDTTNRQHPVARYQQPLRNAGGAIPVIAFAPDGMLAMANADTESAWLWDISGARPRVVAKLTGHEDEVFSVAFSPTGPPLATGSADGSAVLWKTDPAEVIREICADAGEPLTPEEWDQFVQERDYERPCP